MNDPGLDEPIDNAAEHVNNVVEKPRQDDGDMGEEEEETNFLGPTRWWYTSTAFPLMAGTFGPMANAFSICALVENWRVRIPPAGTEEHGIDLKDPKWLIAVNAVSLVCALIANLSLLLNMARRIHFNIAQPITILGFWTASILLIGLIAEASSHAWSKTAENQALTQAYYYAIIAACLYQMISYLMCATVYGAYKGHYSKEFKLTAAQRTLMLQTISFLAYQLIWAYAYSCIEGWKFLDAVYWADFTSLTVGIGGDYVPSTHLGRGLLFPFALGGIIILGLVVGSIRSLVLERGKKKMSVRVTEKTRRGLVKQVLKNIEDENSKRLKWRKMDKDMARALTMQPEDDTLNEKDRRQYEFEAMRKVQDVAAKKRQYFSLCMSMTAFAFLWFMGAFVFWKSERNQKWTYFESLYFSYTSLLTIGYGDFQPFSNSGKPFFVFWSLLAIPTLTILISNMGDTVVKGVKDATIWLGEVTVLPSNDASIMDRLRYGFYRSTMMSKDTKKKKDAEMADSDSGSQEFQEMHPGLAKVFRLAQKKKPSKKSQEAEQRMAKDMEQEEAQGEDEAQIHGDEIARDAHHYRRELLHQIRQLYADASAPEPKKYSYEEWAYFLKLLGEDESDTRYHKRAPARPNSGTSNADNVQQPAQRTEEFRNATQQNAIAPSQSETHDQDGEITQWSWLGQNSPLMGDKDEPEWLLAKLFEKLEQSMKESADETQRRGRGQTAKIGGDLVDSKHQEQSDQDTLRPASDEGNGKKVG